MNLLEAKPKSKVAVKKIIGGFGIKKKLKDLGIVEGTKLEILSTKLVHEHKGPVKVKTGDKEIILGLGIADKVFLNDGKSILELEEGNKGIIERIDGAIREELSELGIKEGSAVNFLKHITDDTLIFETKDKEIMIGEGEASKILVEIEGKIMQSNFLKDGAKCKINKIIGGFQVKEKFGETNLLEGDEITLIKREQKQPVQERGNYVKVKIGKNVVTIGRVMAERVEIEIIE